MRALKGFSLFGGLAVVLTLFLVIGCSNYTPLQPDVPNPLQSGKLTAFSSKGGEESLKSIETYDSEYIEVSKGGEIEVERGEYIHNFVVAANSIPQDTLITIRTENEEILGKEMILFEFGPDGLEFSESAVLRVNMAELAPGTEMAKANLYYFDPEEDGWINVETVDVVDNIAEFHVDHFSKYAISD